MADKPAVGTIGPDGSYELETAGVKGALVGFHKIRIVSQELAKDETDTMPASLIPDRYNRPKTSGLTEEVKAGDGNLIDLKLTTNP